MSKLYYINPFLCYSNTDGQCMHEMFKISGSKKYFCKAGND